MEPSASGRQKGDPNPEHAKEGLTIYEYEKKEDR